MDRLSITLFLLVVISALSVVGLRHQSRVSFAELQALRSERDQLNIEWGRLLLEQGAWSQHQRIENLARTKLGMKTPEAKEVVVLNLQGQLVMNSEGRK